jgi:hypothetical protein
MINLANVLNGKLRGHFNAFVALKSNCGIALPRNSSEII